MTFKFNEAALVNWICKIWVTLLQKRPVQVSWMSAVKPLKSWSGEMGSRNFQTGKYLNTKIAGVIHNAAGHGLEIQMPVGNLNILTYSVIKKGPWCCWGQRVQGAPRRFLDSSQITIFWRQPHTSTAGVLCWRTTGMDRRLLSDEKNNISVSLKLHEKASVDEGWSEPLL